MKRLLAGFLVLASVGLACGRQPPRPRELTVFAAASLREVCEDLGRQFEDEHPGIRVRLNLAGSQELRFQIEQGATADVFLSADVRHMRALEEKKLVIAPRRFAENEPVVIVPRTNPAGLKQFADLPEAKRLVIGAPEVPVGKYTLQILEQANRRIAPDFSVRALAHVASRELNVRQVLAKVVLGEADAGVVYRSDAQAGGDKVAVIAIPAEVNVTAEYLAAAVASSRAPQLGRDWIALVTGPEGTKRLLAAGFSRPPSVAATP
jgi:molybdate transport system substrate-binding protein